MKNNSYFSNDNVKNLETKTLMKELNHIHENIKNEHEHKQHEYDKLNTHKNQKQSIQNSINDILEKKNIIDKVITNYKSVLQEIRTDIANMTSKRNHNYTSQIEKDLLTTQINTAVSKCKVINTELEYNINERKKYIKQLNRLFNQKHSVESEIQNDKNAIGVSKDKIQQYMNDKNTYKNEIKIRPKSERYYIDDEYTFINRIFKMEYDNLSTPKYLIVLILIVLILLCVFVAIKNIRKC